ncbi:MAG: microcystin degradation protein MlrC [Gemmatimonadetes bacterium]|nr:microcystin degradation protein MlrC [Gemmatimonadota bacterium]
MRVLIGELKQETSSFNPRLAERELFEELCGDEIFSREGTNTELAGALDVFAEHDDIEVVPAFAAWSCSSGPVATSTLDGLTDDLVTAVQAEKDDIDGAYISFHGAMQGEEEVDPEGRALDRIRAILGDIPIVTSFDLHGILTDRLVYASDILVAFHTYPHVDMYETRARAARNLVRLLRREVEPTVARVQLPMLVRGDELITETGLFGQAIRTCQEVEASDGGLSAVVFIGNPFTDVPDLRTNVVVTTNNDAVRAKEVAESIARFMWNQRDHLKADLVELDEAIRIANETESLTVFFDAADATSSGAPGDSNHILRGLLQSGYDRRALLPLVDPPAVEQAFAAGVGATVSLSLGGAIDPDRHPPLACDAYVQSLHDGVYRMEGGTLESGGRTAVLQVSSYSILVTTLPVSIMGPHVFESRGLNPVDFDLCVCKSPNGFRTHFQAIAESIVPVDVPGSTSANLRSLPCTRCPRPMFPLDDDVTASIEAVVKE